MTKPKPKEKDAASKDKEPGKPADVTPFDEISIGDQVKHPLWGVGTVLFRSGSGEAGKAIVVFPEEGQKKLMLKYAKLKKVGSAPKSELAKLKSAQAERMAAPEPAEPAEAIIDGGDEEASEIPGDEEPDIFDDEEEDFADRADDDGRYPDE